MENKKILIVDEDLETLQQLEKSLAAQGYHTIRAITGKSAIMKARMILPNLILMDIVLPDMDGAAVITTLKGEVQTRKIPIIFLSGLIGQSDDSGKKLTITVQGQSYPAISKPFQLNELMGEIKQVIA